MAADQRKRRLSLVSAPYGFGVEEQYRAKRMEFSPLQCEFNFNNHVSLKWDDDEKRVVAKEEQIGLSWRHLAPFLRASSAKLADVVAVPKEVFEMDCLPELFCYEVWRSVLTERDRRFLIQFLPAGVEPHEAVQTLFGGENYHFGNPFLKWGSALCSGDFHPDVVVQHEKSFKANKRAYYSELRQYHDHMLRSLQKVKERCASLEDPEAEIIKVISSRSKGHAEKIILADASGYQSVKVEDNASYESPSSIADEKSYYSDNQKLSTIRDAEIQKRIHSRRFMKDKLEKAAVSPNGLKIPPRPKKAEKLQKANITFNDGTKYMSYVKISKKQHELVKNMKQSGSSIQSKNLNHLLGNLDGFKVKPYEMFVEEEQKRICEHWKSMVKKDLPVALQRWRNGQSERVHIMNSLWDDLEDKLGLLIKSVKSVKSADEGTTDAHEVGRERTQGDLGDLPDDGLITQGSMGDTDEESDPYPSEKKSSMQNSLLNVNEELDPSSSEIQSLEVNVNKEFDSSFIQNQSLQNLPSALDKEFDQPSMENYSLQNPSAYMNAELDASPTQNKTPRDGGPLNDNQEFNSMDHNAESDQANSETNDICSMPQRHVAQNNEVSLSHFNFGSAASVNVVELPSSSIKQVWSTIGLSESYGDSNLATQYPATSGLTVGHSEVVLGQPAPLMDLESELSEDGTTKDLLNRHTNRIPFFNPYTSGNRSELLQSLIKCDSNHQEPKGTAAEFHPSNVLMEPSQLPGLFVEQMQPSFELDQRQRAHSEVYMNQNIQNSMSTDNNRFPIHGQEHFTSLNVRDWSNARMPNSVLQSPLSSGGLGSPSWFTNDYRTHSRWPGPEISVLPRTSLQNVSTGDQSLYSMLSQPLHARSPSNSVGPNEQTISSTSFGSDMAAGIPMTSNPIQQISSPLDYLSGAEAATTLKNPIMNWMTLGRQPSALSDPSRKSF